MRILPLEFTSKLNKISLLASYINVFIVQGSIMSIINYLKSLGVNSLIELLTGNGSSCIISQTCLRLEIQRKLQRGACTCHCMPGCPALTSTSAINQTSVQMTRETFIYSWRYSLPFVLKSHAQSESKQCQYKKSRIWTSMECLAYCYSSEGCVSQVYLARLQSYKDMPANDTPTSANDTLIRYHQQ